MKVLFVCTGNICRSPMGELLFPLFFHSDEIETDSAGTQGLISSEIDPSSAQLLTTDGVDSSAFRSKRLTPQLAMSADLILCFTERQAKEIATLAPRVARKTFTLTDFANLCKYCAEHGLIEGENLEDRTDSVILNASMIRPAVERADDIHDPYRREFEVFQRAHDQMTAAMVTIAESLELPRGRHA